MRNSSSVMGGQDTPARQMTWFRTPSRSRKMVRGIVLSYRFPLHFGNFQPWMRDEQMPDERLKPLRMGGSRRRIHHRHDNAGVSHAGGEAAVAPHNSADPSADLLRVFQRPN